MAMSSRLQLVRSLAFLGFRRNIATTSRRPVIREIRDGMNAQMAPKYKMKDDPNQLRTSEYKMFSNTTVAYVTIMAIIYFYYGMIEYRMYQADGERIRNQEIKWNNEKRRKMLSEG